MKCLKEEEDEECLKEKEDGFSNTGNTRIILMNFGPFLISCFQRYLALLRLLMNGSILSVKMISMRLFSNFTSYIMNQRAGRYVNFTCRWLVLYLRLAIRLLFFFDQVN